MNPKGSQHSAQSSGVREEAGRDRLVGWQVDRSRSKCVGAGGGKKWPEMQCRQQGRNAGMTLGQSPKLLTPHPSFTRDLGWAGAPIQPPGLSCCSNKFFQGVALGGGAVLATLSSPARGKMRQLQGPLPRPPTKRRAEESEQPIVAPGPPPGAPGLHPRDLATPPPTPNTGSPGWASSVAASPPHTARGWGE